MANIPMKSNGPLTNQTIFSLNNQRNLKPQSSASIASINHGYQTSSSAVMQGTSQRQNNAAPSSAPQPSVRPPIPTPAAMPSQMSIPNLKSPIRKGQKYALETNGRLTRITARLGWNVLNPQCDVDVSAFLLGNNGKVIGDSWFVFYGQTESPDRSTVFSEISGTDREMIQINLTALNPAVAKIVFVLTINEAFEKKLNFSMLKDAYIRIMNDQTNTELVSFKMTDYYANVTSMMIGELYLHNGSWKFNAIGNGVTRDLAGLCELYGVQVV